MNLTRINAQSGVSIELKKGSQLKVTSSDGCQVADLFCTSSVRQNDVLSSGRSIDYNESILFTTDHILFSAGGFPLLKIIEDTCGRHDFLVTPCSLQMFHMLSNSDKYHPSCQENLCNSLGRFGLPVELITTTFNIFMNYEFDMSGKIKLRKPSNKPGDYIIFEACEDILIGLTACADPDTNGGICKPIDFEILSIT